MVILSVTEGEDKPLKYPDMFRAADLMLRQQGRPAAAPLLRRRRGDRLRAPRRPGLEVIVVSAKTGEGFDAWLAWLERGAAAARRRRDESLEFLRRRVAQLEAELAGRPAPPAALARDA